MQRDCVGEAIFDGLRPTDDASVSLLLFLQTAILDLDLLGINAISRNGS